MMNYQKGKVYKVVNDIDDEEYVGSTIRKLCNRMAEHRYKCKVKHTKLYDKMNTLGSEHFKIVLIEKYPCNSKEELNSREEYWRKELKAVLNCYVCIQDEEHKKTQRKKWSSAYRSKPESKLKEREYHQANKAHRNEYNRNYYSENTDKFKEYQEKQKEKITCECGRTFVRGIKLRHERTKVHMNWLAKHD